MKTPKTNTVQLLQVFIMSVLVMLCIASLFSIYSNGPRQSVTQTKVDEIKKPLAQILIESVLLISNSFTEADSGAGESSAVVINRSKDNYFAITANHCLEEHVTENMSLTNVRLRQIKYPKGEPVIITNQINVMIRDPINDVALFNFSSQEDIPLAKMASEETINKLSIGDVVYNVGCPRGLFPTITSGYISSTSIFEAREFGWPDLGANLTELLFRTSTLITYGNSGGGAFNANGVLIGLPQRMGMIRGTRIPITHICYNIKITAVINVIKEKNLQSVLPE